MDKLIIKGQNALHGSVTMSGAKNAVLPLMAAALLVNGKTIIHRVPDLRDTRTMVRLLEILGAKTEFKDHTLKIDGSTVDSIEAPYELVKTMRASFYVLGPLLARFGQARVSLPGGCAWGPRPVDYHLRGFKLLGAVIELTDGYIQASAKKLIGNNVHFEVSSVGATGNIVMAAVLAEGETIIQNAAREPEIVQLCEVLNLMGAKITGLGSNTLRINGVNELGPAEVEVIPDRIETGTFLMAGAASGKITLKDTEPEHLGIVLEKIELSGASIQVSGKNITVEHRGPLKPVNITTDVFPGFPTDLQAQWTAFMALAEGSSIIKDTIYHDRFAHVSELVRLGAKIQMENNVAIVHGVEQLKGAQVMSTDIRASASLVNAALMAQGKTEISRIYHVDRGYEKIEEKLKILGAEIWRESE
ncbi:MAG: UDP-N-acetylglucosamine 1-carboxyvinyltransferase [Candidatus Neomarinimicrobiota bacterium]